MQLNGIQFHNVEWLEERPGMPGWILNRFPSSVLQVLGTGYGERGRIAGGNSVGCELRFVTDAPFMRLVLSAPVVDTDVLIFQGDYFHSKHSITGGKQHSLQFEPSERFAEAKPESLQHGRFAPSVWRVLVSGYQIAFHYLETFGHEVRVPEPQELPSVRMLAYGSSITQGMSATIATNTYVQQTARRLGWDVLNKALSGSCFCEPEVADFLAEEVEWDVAVLELGVNMRVRFTTEQFRERASHLVRRLVERHPGKPVFLITIYPNHAEHLKAGDTQAAIANAEFKQVLRELHAELALPHVHLIEGDEILTDYAGLAVDLIHPSDYGHILMGEQLSQRISAALA